MKTAINDAIARKKHNQHNKSKSDLILRIGFSTNLNPKTIIPIEIINDIDA